MEVLISVSTTIAEYLIAPIGRQFGYLFCYNCNIRDFSNEIENLADTREGVQGLVDAAERNGEIIFPAVRTWLTKVDDISQESKELVDGQLQARKQLCNVHVPNLNLKSRHQRSRLAKKKLADAEKLKLEGNAIHTSSAVSYPAPPLPVGSTTSAAEEGGAGDFGSRQSVIKQIMEAIKDDQINTIGIYGLGGVGKTTLVKQVGKQAQRDNLFDEIVMALVSQTPDLKRIQDEIADIIGLKFEEESVAGRARRLFARIEEKTSFLVILDDVWDRVELEAIGIPSADRHKGCKVILTSRRLDVCNQMDSQKNFCVQVLSEKEGWNLFVKMAGEAAEYPHLRTLAVDIAKECGGLPLAIVTIARALRKKSQSAWIDAANQLGESMPDDKVFSTLEMSYKYIESEEAKSIFLLCSIIPKDWYILVDDLLVYGMGLGLFQAADTVEKARTRAYALVESLKDSSLLQDGGSEGRVKMHDVIRDVAKSIASKGTHVFLIRNDPGTLNEWPKKDSYQPYTTISISSKDIRVLPDGLECANLETLFLRCQCLSLQIKDNFFLGMKNLKVVHMSNMHLPSLPTSIQCLQNLRTLYLSYCCCMKDISSIGELINLQVLSLRGSHITELPKIIGTLTGLRILDLTGCEKLRVIPPDVIRGLSQLEALYMRNSFDGWGTQVQGKNDGGDASLGLGDLNKLLTTLEILIPNSNCLPETSLFQNLSRFKISIGSSFGPADQYLYSKGLKLKLDTNTSHIKGGIKVLLKKAEHVRLEEMKGSLKSLLYDIDCEGFPNLRCLNVKACDELQHMFSAAEWVSPEAFSVLEKLDLSNLPALTDICHGHLRYACFENLRVLEVGNCDSLKYLFSNSIAKDLSRLQELSVTSCKLMEEIFVTENEEISIDEIALPDLRCLKLEKLPNLKSFGSKMSNGGLDAFFNEKVAFHKLEKLHVSGPTKLRHLFSPSTARDVLQLQVLKVESCEMLESIIAEETEGQDKIKTNIVFPQLQTLELKQLPKLATFCVCDHIHLGSSIQPLFNEKVAFHNLNSLDIYDCNSLKCLFSPNVANSFVRLLEVKMDLCEMIEAVIACEREGEEKINIVFSQLSTLKLHHLPNLTSFYRGRCTVKWPSLKTLQIWSCSAMKTFTSMDPLPRKLEAINQISEATAPDKGITKQPFFELTVALPNLEILSICNMKNLAQIFQNQLPGEFLHKLTHLIVWGCHRLSTVVPWNLSPNLIRLSVKRCNSIQEIFQRPVPVEKQPVVSLSQLEKLELEDLPNLKIVCKADFKLECPSLMLVQLKGCYKMETFSSKFASTPKLKAIKIEDGQELWNNNLNYTVHQLFCEKKHLAPVYDAKFEGDRLKGEGLYKEALSQFELALNISQGMSSCEKIRSVCHFNRGWCLFELKEYVDTIKECTYALELDSTYKDALFDRGLAHEKLGHFEEAITDVKKVLELEPSEERAKVAIIRLEPLAAEEQEIKEAGLGPTYDAYMEGEKLRFKKLYKEALAQFEMGIQVAPEGLFSRKILSQCHFKRGWCFYDLGNYEDAIKENTKALELDPTYWNALFERGLAHEKLENFEAAIADMRKTLELNPSDVGAKRSILLLEPQKALAQANDAKSKGDKLCSENLYEEALSQYGLALQVVPEVSSTMEKRCLYHYKRAWCFFELRKYEEAIKECTNALVLNPTHTNALFERGMAHERLEQFEEAITDVKEVLELEPSNERARVDIIRLELLVAEKRQIKEDGLGPTYDAYSMGEKLRGKKLYEEALSQFDVALQVAPDVLSSGKILSKCHFKRGWCFYALGKHEDEIKEYTKALELNPTNKDVLFERAIAYEKLERFEEAIFDLKKVLQMESSEERAKIAILRLQHMAEEVQEIKKAGLGPAYEAKLEGTKLFRNGLYNESLSKYENFMLALQAAPEMPSSKKIRTTCHYNRAWCFYELGKYEDAIKENTKALELDPTYRDALFERGLAHERLENIETAIADMKKVLELDPSYAKAKNALLRLEPVAIKDKGRDY